MKMYMPLVATEDGIVQFVKQPGISLGPGDILGILTLDDPSRVKHAKPFEGQLAKMGMPYHSGTKTNQKLKFCLDILGNILDGYDNQAIMASTIKDLIEVLRKPDLPYSEAASILATLSGRMPAKLEEMVRTTIDQAKARNQEFPAARIRKQIEAHIHDNVRPQELNIIRATLAPLTDSMESFKQGLKQHEWDTIAKLLRHYESTEKLFGGSIEAIVLSLREEYKTDLDKVAGLVLSHTKAQSKSKLVLSLLEHVKADGAGYAMGDGSLNQVLHGLAALESRYALSLVFEMEFLKYATGRRRK
jgi:acetyl-CoA carboxylase / biotin carboxylase 1